METKRRAAGLHPGWWTLIFVAAMIAIVLLTAVAFNRDFTSYAKVTVVSDRAGLVMEPYAMVKFRGVVVGRVASIQPDDPVKLQLEVNSDQLTYIPANVGAQITAPTVFGGKFVELIAPSQPSPKRLAAGAVVKSGNVSIEANTVFENVVGVLNQIDTAKLNAVLSALAEGFRGKGEALGQTVTDLNQVLLAVNPRSDTIRADYRALKGFADTYSAAAPNLVTVLDAATTTSATITDNAQALDSLLLNVTGLSNSGIKLDRPEQGQPCQRHQRARIHHPVADEVQLGTDLHAARRKKGARHGLTRRFRRSRRKVGDLGYELIVGRGSVPLPRQPPHQRPEGRPRWSARLRFAARCQQELAGAVCGHQFRVGQWAGCSAQRRYWLPGLRRLLARHPRHTQTTERSPPVGPRAGADAVCPPPSGMCLPGAPPYGAPRYAPDGTPLYPGLPPAPPPGRPREPGPPPAGSEPFVPPYPGGQPTCGIITQVCPPPAPPPLPLPPQSAPAP